MSTFSTLSNAKFSRLRTAGFARGTVGKGCYPVVFQGFERDNLCALEVSFEAFVGRFKDACSGIHTKRRLQEAHEIFETGVLPALQLANVEIVDAKHYADSTLSVSSEYPLDEERCADDGNSPAKIIIKIPLRKGMRKIFSDSTYDGHARLEEVLHLFQFLNEAPLTEMGLIVKNAMEERNSALRSRLKKDWDETERRARFVRENDIMGIYDELNIPLPGIFLFAYDRRGVREFMNAHQKDCKL
jgi:hypothetical protein